MASEPGKDQTADHLVRRCNQLDDRGETRVSPIRELRKFNNLGAGRPLQSTAA
jgi:hypothetical protein